MGEETENQETSTAPDLNAPAVLAAIEAAAIKREAALEKRLRKQFDEDVRGLKETNAAFKTEKQKLQEERDAALVKATASAAGVDPDKLTEMARKEGERLAEIERRKFADELKATAEARTKAEERATELEAKARRLSISSLVPRDVLIDSPDVWDIVLRRLDPIVSFQEKDGIEIPILMRDGEVIPGTVGDLFSQAREGRGPLSTLSAFFKSNGKGSGTTSTNGSGGGTKNIHKMTREERAAFTKEHGLARFTELLNSTPNPEVEARSQRR